MADLAYEICRNDATSNASATRVDMKLEGVAIPVSTVDRAKQFCRKTLGTEARC
jgi:hypothetical protein